MLNWEKNKQLVYAAVAFICGGLCVFVIQKILVSNKYDNLMVAVENAPSSAMASLFRGHIESDRENYDKAAYYYHQALSEDPELLDAYYSLGLYYGYIKKDISKAESYFLQAIEVARKTKDTEPEKLFHAKKQYEDSMFLLKNQK